MDILWPFVWALWAVALAVCAIFLIFRNGAMARWAPRATMVSTGVLLALWLLTLSLSLLGLV